MNYRTLLRWAALPVTDRRWAAPLSAVALGFGLFAGVAIGPGATGTLATAPFQIIEMPSLIADGDEAGEEEEPLAVAPESGGGFGGEEESPAFTPIVEEAAFEPAQEEPAGNGVEPQDEKEPAQPEAQVLAGTVVHVNPAASSYTVAEVGGVMSAVHAGKLPPAGAQVEVPIRALANGTLAEAGKRVKTGTKARAKIAGIVTYVATDPAAPGYAVSNRGTSLFVHVDSDPAGATPPLPVLGAYASLSVGIDAKPPPSPTMSGSADAPSLVSDAPSLDPLIGGQGRADAGGEVEPAPSEEAPNPAPVPAPVESAPPPAPAPASPACAPDPAMPAPTAIAFKGTLRQRSISAAGAPFIHADFEGIVAAVCPTTSRLLISADDVREAGHDLLFSVPAGIDTSGLAVGESVLAGADIAADGSLSLTGLAGDERTKGADNAKATQGDLVPAKGKGQE